MTAITKTWLGCAAGGTGLIHLALVIGSSLPIGIVLTLFGIVEFGWGVVTFAREQILAPRWVVAGALIPVVLWSLVVASFVVFTDFRVASALGVVPLAIATVFELFIAAVIALRLRRAPDTTRAPRVLGAGRYLLGVFVAALTVAALTTPALAATPAHGGAPSAGEHTGFVVNRPEHSGH